MLLSSRTITSAYKFFRLQGYSVDASFAYARAEREAEERGYAFLWMDDEGADWYDESGYVPDEILGCVCKDEDGEVRASLWCIADPSLEYARVVEAELAMEVV